MSGDDAGEKMFIIDLQSTLNARKEMTVHLQLILTTANWPQVKKIPHFHANFSSATIIFSSTNLSLKVTNIPLSHTGGFPATISTDKPFLWHLLDK